MRTVFENFVEGAGGEATVELEELEPRGDRVFIKGRVQAKGVRVAPRPWARRSA